MMGHEEHRKRHKCERVMKKGVVVLAACGVLAFVGRRNYLQIAGTRADAKMEPLKALAEKIDWKRLMGSWYVVGVIPTPFDRNCYNAVETYTQVKETSKMQVTFKQQAGSFDAPVKTMYQDGKVVNEYGTEWKVRPVFAGGWIKFPFWLPYIIIEADTADYSYFVVGYPDRRFLWIMSREPSLANYDEIVKRCATEYNYDVSRIWKVPHQTQ
ncbi:Temperature-induced lipocalin-1 [Porphyridium purpureum]|uniref:Temperature-induced lipocalin-1 n=1 Tax=Porphyridium purpureum TaxID=35688 RepID=A0A5J4Z0H1_PORPP|nr:Temperature-induced lipocalin-1 [Porphyridium purpureum]|eukprot:POR6189..scf208_2